MDRTAVIARRVMMRVLREGASALPGETPRAVMRNLQESGSPATFQDNSPKREKENKEESIYEVDDADDISKISPGGESPDSRDWSTFQVQNIKPEVPDNIRR